MLSFMCTPCCYSKYQLDRLFYTKLFLQVFHYRSWTSVRVMTADQRAELLKRIVRDNVREKIPFKECEKIAKDLSLTLEQVRFSWLRYIVSICCFVWLMSEFLGKRTSYLFSPFLYIYNFFIFLVELIHSVSVNATCRCCACIMISATNVLIDFRVHLVQMGMSLRH